MSYRFERQVLLAKTESPSGSDASPGVSDAIPITEPITPEPDPQLIERGHPLHCMSRLPSLTGAIAKKFGFKTHYYGSGAAGTEPRCGRLLEMCGFEHANNAGVSDVYTVADASAVTDTLYAYLAGRLFKSLGTIGSLKLTGKYGDPVTLELNTMGLYQDDADAAIVTPDFGSNVNTPPQAKACTITLDSVSTFILREFDIDCAIPLIPRGSMSGTQGYAGFLTGKPNMTGKLLLEAETKATYDFRAKFEAATQVAASIVIGGTAGNILTIAFNLTYTNYKIVDGDGIAVAEIPIALSYLTDSSRELTLTAT